MAVEGCGGLDPIESLLRFVVLRHAVSADGLQRSDGTQVGDHLDWMFETSDDPNSRLLTFSTEPNVVLGSKSQTVSASRIADHRRDYLHVRQTLEVSGGRGTVTAIAAGRHRVAWFNNDAFRTTMQLDWHLSDDPLPDDHWRIDWQSSVMSIRRLVRGCGLQ